MRTLPEGFHLRFADRSDAGLLLEIMLRCRSGTVAPNSSAYRETVDIIAGQLERGGAVVVYEQDSPIGAGRFYPVPGPAGDPREWVEIKRVGVVKSHRKRGLAAPLVQALETEARNRGYAGGQLGVRSDQPRLVAFWTALGYASADDVVLHTVNPLTAPPITMRKRFASGF